MKAIWECFEEQEKISNLVSVGLFLSRAWDFFGDD